MEADTVFSWGGGHKRGFLPHKGKCQGIPHRRSFEDEEEV